MRILKKFRSSISRSGILGTIGVCGRAFLFYSKELTPSRRRARERDLTREREFDKRFGVRTSGTITIADLSIPSHRRIFGLAYQATSGGVFAEMLSAVPATLADFTFIDFGSGLGRALLLASEYPFHAVRGVEFSPSLHQTACDNIRSYRSSTQKCSDIQSICQDAAVFAIPEEPAIFYFYNPFLEPVMAQVIRNIEQSLQAKPRESYLVYYNPEARRLIDRSPVFQLIEERPVYCIYRSTALDEPRGQLEGV